MTGVYCVQKMDGFIDLPRVNGLRGQGEVRFFGFMFGKSDAAGGLTFRGLPRYPPPFSCRFLPNSRQLSRDVVGYCSSLGYRDLKSVHFFVVATDFSNFNSR